MLVNKSAGEIPRDVFEFISTTIRTVSAKARDAEITPETLLIDDLALDSLDIVRVTMHLEDRYHMEIDLDELPKITRVRDLALIVPGQSLSAA